MAASMSHEDRVPTMHVGQQGDRDALAMRVADDEFVGGEQQAVVELQTSGHDAGGSGVSSTDNPVRVSAETDRIVRPTCRAIARFDFDQTRMHGLNRAGSVEPISRGDEGLLLDVGRGFGEVTIEAAMQLVPVSLGEFRCCAIQRLDEAQCRDDSTFRSPVFRLLKTLLLVLELLLLSRPLGVDGVVKLLLVGGQRAALSGEVDAFFRSGQRGWLA